MVAVNIVRSLRQGGGVAFLGFVELAEELCLFVRHLAGFEEAGKRLGRG
jgi:hypothetical protein